MPVSINTCDPELKIAAAKLNRAASVGNGEDVAFWLQRIADQNPEQALNEGHSALLVAMVQSYTGIDPEAADRTRRAAFRSILDIAESRQPSNAVRIVRMVKRQADLAHHEEAAIRADRVLGHLQNPKAPAIRLVHVGSGGQASPRGK